MGYSVQTQSVLSLSVTAGLTAQIELTAHVES